MFFLSNMLYFCMSNIVIGKVKDQQEKWRGWLVGQFLQGEFNDSNVEIFYKKFKKGEFADKLHLHPVGVEYLIMVSGKMIMKIGEEIVELSDGDYVKIPNNTPDKIIEIVEDSTFIGLRYPSIPDNKVFLEE